MVSHRVSPIVKPCAVTAVAVTTPPDQVNVDNAKAPFKIGVNDDPCVSNVYVPGDVLVAPCEINAPVFCSVLGFGAKVCETLTVTILVIDVTFLFAQASLYATRLYE